MGSRTITAIVLAVCVGVSATAQDEAARISAANRAVVQAIRTGDYGAAVDLAEAALGEAEAGLGPEHSETLASIYNLAILYGRTGRYTEAEKLYLRALEASERLLGPDHPDTLDTVHGLALLYVQAGSYTEAETLYRRALDASERVLGPEHPDTLISVNSLAGLYQAAGRYAEAEPLYRRALEASERVFGQDHPDTLFSVGSLAGLYEATGRYAEAEPLFRRTLEGLERALGPEHPDTLTSVNNLAFLYQAAGRYAEAEPLYRRALEGNERVLGPEHPDTLGSVNNLAGLFESTGRYAEAEPLYRRALEASERVLGREHPDTLGSVNNLAALYRATGRTAEAEPLYRRALEGNELVLGPEHPNTLTSADGLAGLYESTGRYAEAEPLYLRALEARKRVLGEDHPSTLSSVNNLAGLYEKTGRYDQAEQFYRRALEGVERALGPEHPDTLATRGNLSIFLIRAGRHLEALWGLRELDLKLGEWLDVEVGTTQSAALRRQTLQLHSQYQNVGFSLALEFPSEAATTFAANLALKWKKRLAQDDAILNKIARESEEPELLKAVAAVRQGRRALSNVAFDETVPPEEKSLLREALETSEAELRARSDDYRGFVATKSAGADDVRLTLSDDAALVEYRYIEPYDFKKGGFGAARLLAVVLRADAAPAVVSLHKAEVYSALQAFTVDADFRAEADISFDELMSAGHNGLIAPLLPHLDGIDTLYIAPDGLLGTVPFEALQDESGHRLIERLQVHMLQTGRDLVEGVRPATGQGLVAFGGIDFGEFELAASTGRMAEPPIAELRSALDAARSQFESFGPLERTLEEVEYIAGAYSAYRPDEPEPILLTGSKATEAAVKSLVVPPRVLHFATHGYYLPSGSIEGRPLLQSGITLAGANRALRGATGEDGENGILHAVEAQTLNLDGTELVVLSACDTGQGVFDYSEGLEGLPRAFYVAGAQNVLVALWPIGDTAARNFMQRFYENWLSQEVSDPALALRTTKLWYLAQTDSALKDPQNWTPFVLFEG